MTWDEGTNPGAPAGEFQAAFKENPNGKRLFHRPEIDRTARHVRTCLRFSWMKET
jgi:hypothetical protein